MAEAKRNICTVRTKESINRARSARSPSLGLSVGARLPDKWPTLLMKDQEFFHFNTQDK